MDKTTETIQDLASRLLEKVKEEEKAFDKRGIAYSVPWLHKVTKLTLEYLSLDGGLADAKRSRDIEYDIEEICEEHLCAE